MPEYIYNLYEAKTHLSHLIDRAARSAIAEADVVFVSAATAWEAAIRRC